MSQASSLDLTPIRNAILDSMDRRDALVTTRLNAFGRELRTGLDRLDKPSRGLTGGQKFVRHAVLHLLEAGKPDPDLRRAYDQVYRGGAAAPDRRQRAITNPPHGATWVRDPPYPAAQRAVTNPAQTDYPTWAQELTSTDVADFLFTATTPILFSQLAARGVMIDPTGMIHLPARFPYNPPVGGFVEEGYPIPVVRMSIMTTTLTGGRKCASISTFSRELRQHSIPSIEAILRAQMAYDLARVLDGQLVSDRPGSASAPPGLRYGVTALPAATSGDPASNQRADITNLVRAVTEAGGSAPLLMMNPGDAITLAFIPGAFPLTVLQSTNVPPQMVFCIDASGFASMVGAAEVDVSGETLLHEDTVPLPIVSSPDGLPPTTPGAVAWPVRSTWQTATDGLRCIIDDTSWTMMGPGLVQWMSGIAW